jgi:hypothetical protein
MNVVIKQLTKSEAMDLFEKAKVVNRLDPEMLKTLEADGWKVAYDFSIEKKHKGFFIVIEFCMGDFCVSICSKKGHWLLEKKQSVETFTEALVKAAFYQIDIDRGRHWTGEDN